jgi:hypothetical protein
VTRSLEVVLKKELHRMPHAARLRRKSSAPDVPGRRFTLFAVVAADAVAETGDESGVTPP